LGRESAGVALRLGLDSGPAGHTSHRAIWEKAAEERLDGEEPDGRRDLAEHVDAPRPRLVLDADAEPDIREVRDHPPGLFEPLRHELGPLGEDEPIQLRRLLPEVVEAAAGVFHFGAFLEDVGHRRGEDARPVTIEVR
jgi:hypothetical protein